MFEMFFNHTITESSKSKKSTKKESCPKCGSNPCKCGSKSESAATLHRTRADRNRNDGETNTNPKAPTANNSFKPIDIDMEDPYQLQSVDESKKVCKLCNSSPCKCDVGDKVGSKIKSATADIKKKLDIRKSLKEALVGEVLLKILDESLGMEIETSNEYNLMKRNLIESFIVEKGAQKILDTMADTTVSLYETKSLCETYLDSMITFVNEDEYFVDKDEKSDFYNKLKDSDMSDITSLIQSRVGLAIDDFAQSNNSMKNDIENLVQLTQQKIDSSSSDSVKEAYERDLTITTNRMKDNKPKNVYEAMFYNVNRAAINNDSMKSYIKEDGKLDMHKINNNIKVMYTFLEMVNTLRLEKVNESYIKEVLDSLK